MSLIFRPEALTELLEIDAVLVESLLAEYAELSVTLIANIEQSAKINDAKKVEFSAHSLKSSSAALGLDQVAKTAFSCEEAGRNGTVLHEAIARLRSEQAAAVKEITLYLSTLNKAG